MLQAVTRILVARAARSGRVIAADATAPGSPHARKPPARQERIDRKNCQNCACNAAGLSGINTDRLTCELSLSNAEIVQSVDKGGVPSNERSHRHDSGTYSREKRLSHILLFRLIPGKEVESGPIGSSFLREEAERGWKRQS
jgi:hypothetical protein